MLNSGKAIPAGSRFSKRKFQATFIIDVAVSSVQGKLNFMLKKDAVLKTLDN